MILIPTTKAAHTILPCFNQQKAIICCPHCCTLLSLFLALRLCNTPGLATNKEVKPSAACIPAIHLDAEGVIFASSWCCAVGLFLYPADMRIFPRHGGYPPE